MTDMLNGHATGVPPSAATMSKECAQIAERGRGLVGIAVCWLGMLAAGEAPGLHARAEASPGELPAAVRVVGVTTPEELTEALDAAQPGDHIVLGPGDYDGREFEIDCQASASRPLVVRAEELLTARITRKVTITGSYGEDMLPALHTYVDGHQGAIILRNEANTVVTERVRESLPRAVRLTREQVGPEAPAASDERPGRNAAELPEPARVVSANRRVPVILDTDIGDDIDDTWALAMLLKSPELDLRLAVSATGDTLYRARLIARMLEIAGRCDVPIGIGIPGQKPSYDEPQRAWVERYDLEGYPGRIYPDGVEAIVETLKVSAEPVTLICIGPLTNIAEVLRRDPGVARKAHFVGMHGSVNRGYGGKAEPDAEWNVEQDPKSAQKAFTGDWLSRTITPIDTCELARLTGEDYARLLDSDDPMLRAVLENDRIWREVWMKGHAGGETSVLFDTVAIHLAHSREFLTMEKMSLTVTDDGFTVRDPSGPKFDVAVDWTDLDGYHDYLSRRLLGEIVR